MVFQVTTTSFVDGGHRAAASRTVSWNASGTQLCYGLSDCTSRIVVLDGGSGGNNNANSASASASLREVLVIQDHTAPVTTVRFHPTEENTLLTAASDQTVRLWDCRDAQQKSLGSFGVRDGKSVVAVEWCGSQKASNTTGKAMGNRTNTPSFVNSSHYLVVTERNGSVAVYDRRTLSSGSSSKSNHPHNNSVTPLHVMDQNPNFTDMAIFGPHSGDHLIAATTFRREGTGDLCIWKWNMGIGTKKVASKSVLPKASTSSAPSSSAQPPQIHRFQAHMGPIYTLALSPDGTRLATGGYDALVGLWETDSMICTHTIHRRTKFIRSMAFSHDSKLLASCSEDVDIDLASAASGEHVGTVELPIGSGNMRGGGSTMERRTWAYEVDWHPKAHILACVREESPNPLCVAQLSIALQ